MKFGNIKKILFFGGGQLLFELALKLKQKGMEFDIVTSQRHVEEPIAYQAWNDDSFQIVAMDSPLQQGKTMRFGDLLSANKLTFHVSEDVNTDKKVISLIEDGVLGISLGAAWIFKEKFLDLFKGRILNLHGRRLPQDRGGGGFSWQIMRNNRLGSALIHQIDPGIDTGKIVKFREFVYPETCRKSSEYQDFLNARYHELFDEFINEIKNNSDFATVDQLESQSIYWPRLSTDIHGAINWDWKLEYLERFICAFDDPYKGAFTFMNDQMVRIKDVHSDNSEGCFHPFQTGLVYRKYDGALFVATTEGSLVIKSITDEHSNDMMEKVRVGDRFYTPQKYLEDAMTSRVIYTSKGKKEAK
ncbi:hypothetical protein KKF81_01685 [Candidatus Micrarchaeota archaeon]|nr:hypothetical protein [Candidatus Micrarchaeota archaeon]